MIDTLLLVLAALIVGISKGGLASAGAIAVPLLSLFMNPVTAAALLLPVYIVTDWVGVWLYRRHFSKRNLWILTPSILLGVFIATLITPYTSEAALLVFTGLIGLWHCLRSWLKRNLARRAEAEVVPGIFWGMLTGIASFITHSGAPPSQAYLLPQNLPKLVFSGTVAISFAVGNLVKLPAYWAIGQLDGLNWTLILVLAAVGIIGTFFGRWLTARLSQALFTQTLQVLLFVLSIVLLARGGLEVLG